MAGEEGDGPLTLGRRNVLRWVFIGRLALVTGIFIAALMAWRTADPQQTLIATVMFVTALSVTAASFWYTHILGREPGVNFCYLQVLVDVALITALVHATGGGESSFAPLFILVIAAGALLLPLPGGVLIGALASMLYFAVIVWGHAETLSPTVLLQISLFALVALATGWLGDRVRRAGQRLGEVQSELRQLRLDTDDILGTISTGVITVDGQGRLAYMNHAAEVLLGFSLLEWQGRGVEMALEGVAPGMGRVIRRSLDERVPLSRYKTMALRDGERVTMGVSTTILDREEGGAPSVTAIFQDITDHEQLELLNLRSERLEAVAELSASMAHEIRNPLAAIRSAVEQLTGPGLDAGEQAILRRLVVGESERLSRLLSDFIEFSRLRIGAVKEVDLAGVTREALELIRQHPDARGVVHFETSFPKEEVLVPGDGDLLHRAIFNLLLNAAQFAGDGGTVTVELSRPEEVPGRKTAPMASPVRLSVRDSGPGVHEEDLPRIFDPFYTTRKGGSGLGLSVVHRAVQAHSGVVTVESEGPGSGAEFVIYLPGGPVPEGVPA